jgi:GNAT superfamily N-acetyltransferase
MPLEGAPTSRDVGLTIREALPAEYQLIGDLTVRAYLTVGDPLLGSPTYTEYEHELRDVAGRAETCRVLVAIDRGENIVGTVTYVPGPGTPWSESEREGEAGFRALAVDPSARGRGVGRALAGACLERALAAARIGVAIYTRPAMTAAHQMYASMGFVRDQSRDWEFEPGEWLWSYVLAF